MMYAKRLAQGLSNETPSVSNLWSVLAAHSFKFLHILGELSVSLECLCVRTALNRAEGNCITSRMKAKWKKG